MPYQRTVQSRTLRDSQVMAQHHQSYPGYSYHQSHTSVDSEYESYCAGYGDALPSSHSAQMVPIREPVHQHLNSSSQCTPSPGTSTSFSYSSSNSTYSPTFTYPTFSPTYQLSSNNGAFTPYSDITNSPNESGSVKQSRSAFEAVLEDSRRTLPPIPLRMPSFDRTSLSSATSLFERPRMASRTSSFERPQLSHRTPSYERPIPYTRHSTEAVPTWKTQSSRAYLDYSYPNESTSTPEPNNSLPRQRMRSQESEAEHSVESVQGDRPDATTPFISKLAHLLSHPEYSHVIRWNAEGTMFVFAHGAPQLLEVFARFFRHSNVHSFVRQLNIYGFTRLSTLELLMAIESAPHPDALFPAGDYSGFMHPLFYRSIAVNPANLGHLKPKAAKKKTSKPTMKDSEAPNGSAPYPSPKLELPSLRMELPPFGSNQRLPPVQTHLYH